MENALQARKQNQKERQANRIEEKRLAIQNTLIIYLWLIKYIWLYYGQHVLLIVIDWLFYVLQPYMT